MKQAIKWCSGYTHRFREALAAMTPAIELLNHLGHPYDLRTFDHPANAKNYAQAAATALNIPADQIFKTLLWRLNTGVQIVVIAAASEAINPKALAKLAGAKKAELLEARRKRSQPPAISSAASAPSLKNSAYPPLLARPPVGTL